MTDQQIQWWCVIAVASSLALLIVYVFWVTVLEPTARAIRSWFRRRQYLRFRAAHPVPVITLGAFNNLVKEHYKTAEPESVRSRIMGVSAAHGRGYPGSRLPALVHYVDAPDQEIPLEIADAVLYPESDAARRAGYDTLVRYLDTLAQLDTLAHLPGQ